MNRRPALLAPSVLALLLVSIPASASAAEDGARRASFAFGGGMALYQQQASAQRASAGGLALTFRVEDELAPRTDVALTFTWGLTDWARAKEYIEAGNRAAQWTTDELADVEAWVANGPEDKKALRILGAFFADAFLIMTYVAVPVCYVASPFGATSHLQVDVAGTFRFPDGPTFAYLEAGGGVATLPYQGTDWRNAAGPVLGVGVQIAGKVRVGARAFYSPTGWNGAPLHGSVLLGAFTISTAR